MTLGLTNTGPEQIFYILIIEAKYLGKEEGKDIIKTKKTKIEDYLKFQIDPNIEPLYYDGEEINKSIFEFQKELNLDNANELIEFY